MISVFRVVSGIFLLSLVIFNAPTQQAVLTTADRKEILSVLFEPELAAAQEKAVTILLAPGTDHNWLVDLPGISFKRLKYEEEKQVSEYYTLWNQKIQTNFVEVWLSKGNFCKKAGSAYRFHKEDGKWKSKIINATESHTSPGTACVGCKTGSGLIYQVPGKEQPAVANDAKPKDLLLTGKALDIRCSQNEGKYIRCDVDLSLDFSNQSKQPIIILEPFGVYELWQGGRSLALTKADSEVHKYVYSTAAWPSVYYTDGYNRQAVALDQATPPAQLTRVIAPGESLTWPTTVHFPVAEENTCDGTVGVKIGWKEIKKLTAPLWLKVTYEMWPSNVENFRKGLGGQLQERWKKHGNLYLEEQTEGYWFAHLTSEPIELNFQLVQLR